MRCIRTFKHGPAINGWKPAKELVDRETYTCKIYKQFCLFNEFHRFFVACFDEKYGIVYEFVLNLNENHTIEIGVLSHCEDENLNYLHKEFGGEVQLADLEEWLLDFFQHMYDHKIIPKLAEVLFKEINMEL